MRVSRYPEAGTQHSSGYLAFVEGIANNRGSVLHDEHMHQHQLDGDELGKPQEFSRSRIDHKPRILPWTGLLRHRILLVNFLSHG